jgi:hypothetical protein
VGGGRLQEEVDRVAKLAVAQQAIVFRLVTTEAVLEKSARPSKADQPFSADDIQF